MRILFLSRWFPYPADNGSKLRVYNILKYLSSHHQIDLLSFYDTEIKNEHVAALFRFCREIEIFEYKPFEPNQIRALLAFLSPKPRAVVATYSHEMSRAVRDHIKNYEYDLIVASQRDMAPYVSYINTTQKMIEEVESVSLYEQQFKTSNPFEKFRHRLMWRKWVYYLKKLIQNFDAYTVVSIKEKEIILNALKDTRIIKSIPMRVIPNGIDPSYYDGIQRIQIHSKKLIYSGSIIYDANFDAVLYFILYILPCIQAKIPDVQFVITGKVDQSKIEKLPDTRGVQFTGHIEDIRPEIASSWVSVVPLRTGGGTRLKILESLAIGTPVVTTHKGVEGLDLKHGQDLLIADDPQIFANEVINLIENKPLRRELSENGRKAVIEKYNWESILKELDNLIIQVCQTHRDKARK